MELKIDHKMKHDFLRASKGIAVDKVIRYSLARIVRGARRRAPVKTGNLRRSFDIEITDNGKTGIITAYADYSGYVEMGTRFMNARPFLKPAVDEEEPEFKAKIERIGRLDD